MLFHIRLIASIAVITSRVFANEYPTASVSNGILVGTTTSLYAATATVNKFLGIPYAAPPVRFQAPSAVRDWSGPKNASSFGNICYQQTGQLSFITLDPGDSAVESEDCLFLNVFQPGGRVPDYGWPIMLWIHGGGLQFGSGSHAMYDGSRFAAYEEVILVTFNYRLSVFGFPGAPDLPNFGFLDQRYAVKWVQNNIRSFRGDPSRVTIFGESSGGISVDALLTLPPVRPSFQAAIIQSGTVLSNSLASLGINPTAVWNATLQEFDCTYTLDAVACLRSVPAMALKSFAITNAIPTVVVVDNATYSPNSAAARKAGTAANVPVLVGTTADDGSLFTLGQTSLTAFIDSIFGILPELASSVSDAYAVGKPGTGFSETTAIVRIFTEVGLQCPTALLTRQIQAMGTSPVWRYIYNATFPDIVAVADAGAFHSSELPIVFGTYNVSTATAQQYALSDYMRGAWARFAKAPMTGPGWGALGTFNGTDLGLLGAHGSSGVTVVSPKEIDVRCALYDELYSLFG